MATMTQTAPRVKTTRKPRPFAASLSLTINGQLYEVHKIDAGECGRRAFRLVKLANDGAVYDVIATHAGLVECDCPSYESRHRGLTSEPCKHGRALVELGLLDAPAPADDFELNPPESPAPVSGADWSEFDAEWRGSAPAVEPVTPELVAAYIASDDRSAFPADQVAIIRHMLAEAAKDGPPDDASQWVAWTDQGSWELNDDDVEAAFHAAVEAEAEEAGCCAPDEPQACLACQEKADAPRLTLDGLAELHATAFRSWETAAGDLLAEALEDLARRVRLLDARTPADFRDREEAALADHRRQLAGR